MDATLKQELEDWGLNTGEALERFTGNEALLERFLRKFPDDPNMGDLEQALKAQDAEAAFKACHALKGVAGNLALAGFLQEIRDLTEILRAGSLDGADELFAEIKKKYDSLIAILKQ